MRVHHLNCVSACPLGGHLMDGLSRAQWRGRLATHCLLVEGRSHLILCDTGYGTRDVARPRGRIAPFFRWLNRPDLREEMTAVRQIERLGFDPRDVRHIVLTHLDFDHAGGLDDFPQATVHLLGREREAALERRTWLDRARYRPEQWSTEPNWRIYSGSEGEPWFGFECVRDLTGVDGEVFLVPLIGHTLGHAGIAVRRDNGWLLLAGDAYFHHGEMDPVRPHCTPGLAVYQALMQKDRRARLANQERLRRLMRDHGEEVEVVSAHDLVEFERLAERPSQRPAGTGSSRSASSSPRSRPATARAADDS